MNVCKNDRFIETAYRLVETLLKRAFLENEDLTRRRRRTGKEQLVEVAFKEWFLKVRDRDGRLDGPLLSEKAEELAKMLGKNDFVATEGWFQRWKKRENISWGKPHGEQGDVDAEGASG